MSSTKNPENVIEFLTGSSTATVSFNQQKYITRIKKLKDMRPDECEICAINSDGSLVAHVPRSWIKISPPRKVSEARRQAASERMKAYRKKKNMVQTDNVT